MDLEEKIKKPKKKRVVKKKASTRRKKKSMKKQPNSKVITAIIRLGGVDAVKQYLKTGKRAKKLDPKNSQHRAILAFYARNNYVTEPFDKYLTVAKDSFGLIVESGELDEIFKIVKERKDRNTPIILRDILREKSIEFMKKQYPKLPRKKIKMYRLSPARMLVRFKADRKMNIKIIRTVRGFLQMEEYEKPEQEQAEQQ